MMPTNYCYSLALLVLSLPAAAMAQTPLGLSPQEGVLLLRNGQILHGKITPAGDRYLISLPTGEVRVKSTDVELHCRDLDEAYACKRQGLQAGNVHEHLNLAQWCIQQDLLGHAAEEIGAAMNVDPRHPRIELLERRLSLAQHKPAVAQPTVELADAGPSSEDLDRLTRSLPPGTVETFTNSIQPMLLNNCTAAGCHGPGSGNEHRWVRISVSRTSSRRLTQRNLHSTVQLIDREKPLESLLLTVPSRPHGKAKTAFFANPQSPQFRQLAAWVQQVALAPESRQPTTVDSQTTTLSQPRPASPIRQATFEGTIPLEPDQPQSQQPASTVPGAPGLQPPSSDLKRSEPQRGAASLGFEPKDPFDPEIFNRRYFR